MKLADYVIEFLEQLGIRNIFGITGGAVVHFFDSADKYSNINSVFCHHEQAAALAAVSYAKARNSYGAAIVTTGPGGTNTITGVLAAWQDSIPCIFISGQSRIDHVSHGKKIRQLGTQEFDIVTLVKPITKYAVLVDDPNKIRYFLEKAAFVAKEGRPGPVWIDIPLDFQWSMITPDTQAGFDCSEIEENLPSSQSLKGSCNQCNELLSNSKRPLVLAGYGIRLASAEKEFRQFIETFQVPFVSTWTASDIVETEHKLYTGRLGHVGQRGANLAIQNCDLLIGIGSHLSIPLTGTLFKQFARKAKIVLVDIDKDELDFETINIDLSINSDAKVFITEMIKLRQGQQADISEYEWWIDKCNHYNNYNKVPVEWWDQKEYVNPYVFVDYLSDELRGDEVVVVDGGGTNLYISFQAFKVRLGQRLILSSGICSMGTGVPESIGTCFANDKKNTICLTGDGSLQFNIQELQTIFHHKLPVKIFVMNNEGYLAIRHTQGTFLNSNFQGSDIGGGLSMPDFMKVASAYGIKSIRINNHQELKEKVKWSLNEPGPVLCELMVSRDQEVIPRQGFDVKGDGTHTPRPLEDMYPYLDRKEFHENMVI